MDISKQTMDGTLIISVKGRLDTNTAPEFKEYFDAESQGAAVIKIDLANLEYVSSAGLRSFLQIHKDCSARGAKYSIENANEAVSEVFAMTGFSGILNIV
jgi:anti-anti-sigma factor